MYQKIYSFSVKNNWPHRSCGGLILYDERFDRTNSTIF